MLLDFPRNPSHRTMIEPTAEETAIINAALHIEWPNGKPVDLDRKLPSGSFQTYLVALRIAGDDPDTLLARCKIAYDGFHSRTMLKIAEREAEHLHNLEGKQASKAALTADLLKQLGL